MCITLCHWPKTEFVNSFALKLQQRKKCVLEELFSVSSKYFIHFLLIVPVAAAMKIYFRFRRVQANARQTRWPWTLRCWIDQRSRSLSFERFGTRMRESEMIRRIRRRKVRLYMRVLPKINHPFIFTYFSPPFPYFFSTHLSYIHLNDVKKLKSSFFAADVLRNHQLFLLFFKDLKICKISCLKKGLTYTGFKFSENNFWIYSLRYFNRILLVIHSFILFTRRHSNQHSSQSVMRCEREKYKSFVQYSLCEDRQCWAHDLESSKK